MTPFVMIGCNKLMAVHVHRWATLSRGSCDPDKYSHISNPSIVGTRSKKFSLKNKKDLGMAYQTPPLKKVKKQGEMPLPSLCPIPLKKCRI